MEQEKQAYFKLSTNEYGKHWLFYRPLKSEPGIYGCWMPIDDEFYEQFKKLSQPEPEESQKEFLAFLNTQIEDYKHIRDGWKVESEQYAAYDLVVREYRKVINKFIQRKK